MKNVKPLGKKGYGSIPHLLGSKLGPGDHHIHEGQHRIATEKVRDKHDEVIVQIKYDGSNVCVANIQGQIVALTRSGYTAESSPWLQHKLFAKWVEENKKRFLSMLEPGERVCGEWMLQAHGIKYKVYPQPFVAFDVFCGEERLNYGDFCQKLEYDISIPIWLNLDKKPLSLQEAIEKMNIHGQSVISTPCAIVDGQQHEGLIYRVERKGKLDFIAKWVRPDFQAGKYLPEKSGSHPVYNLLPFSCVSLFDGE